MLTLFKELNKNQASVWVYENKLKLTFTGGTPPDQLIDKVKQKRENILDFLNEKSIFSVEDFKRFISSENHAGVDAPATSSKNKKIEAIFPATSLQQGFVYHYLAQPQDDAYRVQLLLDYHASINVDAYQKAWTLASRRFPILRTAFNWEGKILQIVTAGTSIDSANFRHEDITQLSEEERNRAIDTLQQHDRTLPFDLRQPGLARFTLIKQHQQLVTVLITLHHSIIDGWSYPVLLQTVHDYYNALAQGRTPEIVVDNAYLAAQQYYRDHQTDTDIYWSERKVQWQGANDLSALLSHRVDLTQIKTVEKPAEQQLTVQGNAYEQLKNTCRTQGVTLNVALQFAWHKLLHIYTGDEQTIVGTTVSGRDIPVEGIESSVGLYINTLPLAVQWGQPDNIATVLQNIQKDIADLNSHSAVSLASLQSDGERLFQSLLVFENYPAPVADENQTGIEQTLTFRRAVEKVDYPLSLMAYEQDNRLVIKFNYGEDWLTDKQAQRLLGQLERILHAIACHPEQPHTAITCLSEAECHTLLHSWNQTDTPYPQDKTLQQLFETQAVQHPDAIAVEFEEQTLSYGELNRRANQLAHHLIALGVRPDDRVAICLERSPDMVVGILAILKAGGAYLPLDPAYPTERLTYMLEDAAPVALLTQTAQANKLITSVTTVWLDNPALGFDTQSDNNPDTQALGLTSRHLAYVIYTSGSTGKPKGVMVEHRNILRLIINNGFADIGSDDCVAHCANPAFDAATWEIWAALLNGSCLHIVPNAVLLEPTCFRDALLKGKVTALWLTVGLFNEYLDTLQPVFEQLRYLLVGGDVLNPQKIKQVLSADHPPAHLLNGYGPTESTTFATTYAITAPVDVTQSIPIGRPIANTRIYLLDAHQQPVPVGASGEVYISGDGVARGYLHQPELTTERFLADPFSSEPGAKMYKTGDLGRWLPDGNIEYLGRNDFQIKIRGFRIELGEIESALAAHPQVKQAVVIDRDHHGNKVLAAYLVIEGILVDEALLTHLLARLPDYMLPASFTFIDAIPLTLNGKVDRRALPDPIQITTDHYAAPRNALETQLCTLWQGVLGVEQVSIHDNFFRIGGDSIVSIQLASKLRQAGFSLQVKTIFEAPTVAQLAPLLMQTASTAEIVAEQGLLNGEFALLPVQQTFFDWQLAHPHHWNQAFMVQIPGNIQASQLEQALIALTERHDILRAHFVATEQRYCQCYSADTSSSQPRLKHGDIRQCNQDERYQQLTQWQSGFDYHNGPLWQAAHLTGYADGSARLFFAFHHLIIDAVSWRIIAEDMRLLLQGMALPAKTSSYRQWVAAVHQYAQQQQHEVPYWQQVLAGNNSKPVLDSLTHHQLGISVEMTDILLHEANAGYHTEINDLLLSALTVALQETFTQPVNHIILEGHGREAIDNTIDVSETVGWFTTLYPVRLEKQSDMADTLIHTKEMLRTVPNKGIGYGALQQAGYLTGDLPAISFNYLGQLGSASHQDWSITDDDCGTMVASENDSHLLLGINGVVQAGKLLFYVDSRLSSSQTAVFIRAFEQALNDVIIAAQKQVQTGGIKTASDYGINGLSGKHLRQLQQQYQIEALYPATSLQQGFIYHHLAQPQDDAYRVQLLLDYHAPVDVAAYQQAWTLASRRFPILRTAFDWEGEILQIVTAGASIDAANFRHEDITQLSEEEKNRAIDKIQQYDLALPFDFSQPGLARFTLIKQHQQLVTVLITLHHSIIDGWSYPVLLQTIHEYYNALTQGQAPKIVVDNTYLATQQYYREHQVEADIYWTARKAQYQNANDLSALLSHRIDLTQIKVVEKPAEQQLTVQGNAYEQLKNTCRTQGVTLNVALQFAWHKLLHIYTGDEQTIVGTTISGRDVPVEGIESSVGLYINTLPLVVQWKQTDSVVTVLQYIQKDIADLNSHSAVSLASLQSGGERLFQSLLVFENYPAPVADENQTGIEQTLIFRGTVQKVDYPLSLIAYEQSNRLVIKFNYDEDWLTDEQAQRSLGQLERILHAVACHPDQPHTSITYLSEAEHHTLLNSWNQTDAPYQQDKTLPQLFETQATQHPDAIAVEFEEQTLSYGELNRRANRLAHDLITLGVRPDERVAICVERSPEMVVGLLAILKAGGAYVPLDPALPDERLAHILKDSAPVALLTQTSLAQALDAALPSASHITVLLDKQPAYLTEQLAHNPDVQELAPHHLAYVIYTSGSTGLPKGVEMSQAALSNLLQWHRHTPEHSTTAGKTLQFAALGFDVAFQEIFTTLCEGGCLVLINEALRRDPQQLLKLVQQKQIERIFLPYVALQHFADAVNLSEEDDLSCLRHIITAGEQLRITPAIQRLLQRACHCRLHNHYGPTESHVVTSYTLDKETEHWPTLPPIGRPIANTQIYILDPNGQPVPLGVTGEIYIAGKGVARGYLNRPELTAERFISCPFSTEPGARMYKTGDLGRWLPDGNIDYLGRNDFQVKIRGFRIELGEIENALAAHPQVKQAVVIDREHSGHKVLAAYLVSEGALSDEILLEHLSDRLPDYMLPASFTFMEAIPLTLNGKVNRRALPEPVFGNRESYVAPRNALEIQLCAIWQAVLELERVGIEDNFFRIGGNSLTAIKLIAAIRRTLSTDISLAQLFELKTIAGLATQMDEQICTVIPHLTQSYYPLSFAQERMLFIEQYEQGSDVYHIPYLAQLAQDTSLPLLKTAINQLTERHAVLRTVYRSDDQGQMYQKVLDEDLVIQSQSCDDRDMLLTSAYAEIATPFDLTIEPSLRLRHYQVADSHYLLLLWHHIAMDGWSIDIFIADLAEIYHALQAGHDSQLPELEINYGDYAAWQRDYLQGDVREQQLAYWQQVLAGYESLALPIDHPRPAQVNYQGRNVNFELDTQLSEQLRTLAKTQETTLYTVLLSAFYLTLAKLSGQDDIVIGTPTDNRHHAQTLPLLGMFVNSLALRAQLQHTDNVTALIAQTHKLVTGAKAHQDMPFEQLLDALKIERDTARHPIFQVMFSVQTFGENNSGENPSDCRLPFSPVTLDETLYSPAKFDLSLFLSDGKTAITGCLNYALSLFNETSITRIADIYQRVLTAFVADQQQPLSGIDILSVQERHTLLNIWNQTDAPYPQDKTLQQQFEVQAATNPDNIALVFEGETLTYHQLNERANQLAFVIRERYQQQQHQTMPAETLIALYFDRSLEMIISMLAVLKAGGAYVPVSPEYPTERVQFILTDTATPCVLTQQRYLTTLQQLTESSILIAADNQADTVSQPVENPESISKPTDLAYIIYTSGTTGQPKGVMIEHKNVAHLAAAQTTFFDVKKTTKSLMFAAYVFDASVYELFPALLNGLTLYLCSEAERNAPAIVQLIQREGIEMATLPPAILKLLTDVELPSLQLLVTGGESPSLDFMDHFSQHSNVINSYGPTEITVCATQKLYQHGDIATNIGQSINNVRLYVLDSYGNPSPVGAPGELYIGGAGVARGYLNRPELTAERFVANPFATAEDIAKGYTRLYKTGDLVRWLPNGELEYLGRNDFQVKIRGYRIELGEIESALTAHTQIKQAVVIDHQRHGHKVLAAYLVTEDTLFENLSDEILLTHLSGRLPDYMLPASFIFMEAIPLTLNGKVNRRALPEPVFGNRESYVAPRNALETQLCAIWQDVLELERVGIEDNFFHIGGNSLLAIKLTSVIRHKMAIDIPLNILFSCKCIALLSQWLATDNKKISLLNFLTPESMATDKLFMIHPANGGSESYAPLANMLADNYNCIGIDNYNLSTDNQIDSLQRLAQIYMELILTEISIDQPIRILGWSLGGQLAMEVAYQLEQLGAQKIQLFLLDTVINNAEITMLKNNIDMSNLNLFITDELQKMGASDIYINKVLETAPLEYKISDCDLSGILKHTNITLFKAGEINPNHNDYSQVKLIELIIKVTDNNISQWVINPLEIKLLDNHHHNNILECTSVIRMEIINSLGIKEEISI
ncbi:non-ribosomal peptide synthetase [Xenorhabdus hominickii]|uniref:Pyoverdine synthetase I n=1 Tax=Xenorhabdus hominickii TaxID=351679 RepID=A0A2G0Q2T6_XENHO|nr:non-ribosomal peptide synthetase [Xenorhabdus hominickii]AOM39757.1 hypothetical protein A9255_03675 [Xenorhabdus hominickii]PHM53530.1 pyoverdine synthetase I [Xenorhabdus hominickii]